MKYVTEQEKGDFSVKYVTEQEKSLRISIDNLKCTTEIKEKLLIDAISSINNDLSELCHLNLDAIKIELVKNMVYTHGLIRNVAKITSNKKDLSALELQYYLIATNNVLSSVFSNIENDTEYEIYEKIDKLSQDVLKKAVVIYVRVDPYLEKQKESLIKYNDTYKIMINILNKLLEFKKEKKPLL
ncbi:MAG: hypothetical protein RSA10_01410 [Bacilli bacterium]